MFGGKGVVKMYNVRAKTKKKALFQLPVQQKYQAIPLLVQWRGVAFNLKSPDRAHFIYAASSYVDKTDFIKEQCIT